MQIEVIATCGCVCNLRAEYNNVEQSLMDVEINIVTPCNYHAAQQPLAPDGATSRAKCSVCGNEEAVLICQSCS